MSTTKALKYFGILISFLWGLQISAQNEQTPHAWSGDNPESRSGGCAFFTLTPNPSPPTCNGFNDGVASIIPSDGVGPYTYNWIGGPSTQTWNNVGAGTYTVIVFDQGQGGVPCNIDVFVNEPGPLTVFAMNAISPTCFGACNGEAAPIVIGGNGGYSFSWDSGETGFTANQLCNPFALTITDSEGCVLDTTYNFNNEPNEIIISADTTLISCSGETDGAIDINISGGSPDYTFSWSGPGGFSSPNQNISGLPAGSYVITVTDENNCEATETYEITEPLPLDVIADIAPNPCASDTLGSIELTITGGTPNYNILWTGPGGFSSSGQAISDLITGTYELELTDANGCQLFASYEITAPPAIQITLTPTDITCNGANDGSVTAEVIGGAGSFTYQWNGPGSFSSNTLNISGLSEGSYTLTATDSSGCSKSEVVIINEPEVLVVDGLVADVLCAGELNGAISLTVSGGTPNYSFLWIGPGGFTSSDESISGLAPGDYTVEITDDNGCSETGNFTVGEPAPIQITETIVDNFCAGQSTGSIDLDVSGGTFPYTFSWSGPAGFISTDEDITNLAQGSYTVEVTDSSNCVQVEVYTVDESNPLELTLTPTLLTCPDDTDGSILLEITGGTPDYDTEWTGPEGFISSDQNISGLAQGVYEVTVTDSNGCESIDATEILAPDTLLPLAASTPVSCNGLSDGTIAVSVTGGTPDYEFSWSGPNGFTSNSANISSLEPGQYDLTITDASGCTTSLTVNLDDPEPITLSADITDATCNGVFDGAIELNIDGGTPPYSVQWSGPGGFSSNNQNISGLNLGNYTALVTDSLGCSVNSNFTVGFGEGPQVDAVVTDASCDTNDDGSIEATVSGGTPPYSVFWQGPNGFTANTLSIFNLEAGTYTFFITDAADCFAEINYTVNNPSGIEIDADITDVLCAGDPTGAIDITLTGVIEPITIAWSGPAGFTSSDQDIDNLVGGDYTITITDSLNCITQQVFTINAPTPIDLSLLATQPACGLSNGQLIASVSGGTVAADYTYLWTDQDNNILGSTNQISGLGAGTYTVTVSDDNGCTVAESAVLSETDLEIDASITDLLCNGDTDGAIDVIISGGAPPYTTDWSGPDGFSSTDANIAGLNAGEYILTVSDSLNCLLIESFQVSQPDSILITQSSENITCAGDSDGSISVSVTGGTPPYIASWSGPDGFTALDTVLTNLAPGTYTLVLTDDNGCSANTEVTITEEPEIAVVENITDISCSGAAEGAIDISIAGGNLPLDIAWSGPGGFSSDQADIANLIAGDYTLVITDINGCVFAENYTVAETDPILIDANISPASCAGDDDASISVTVSGGTPEYAYSWSGPDGFTANTADISNLAPGEYTLVVTDADDCFSELIIELLDTLPIDLSADITDATCNGVFDGAINLNINGGTPPYSVQWSGPGGFSSNNQNISGLNLGNYTALVTDSLGCSVNSNFTVGFGEGPQVDAVVTDASCDTNDDGSIEATVSGGTPPYSVFWQGPNGFTANTLSIFNLEAGTYTFFITDAADCFAEINYTVNNPSGIEIDADITDVLCAGDPTGAIDITLTGVIEPITIAWSGPAGFTSSDQDIDNLVGGDYTITITDSLNCITQQVFTINAPTPIDLSLLATQPACGLSNGQLIASVSGGTVAADYNYLWTDQDNNILGSTNQISGLGAGTYTVTVSDDNGCTVAESAVLSETDLEIDASITDLLCNGDTDGAIDVIISGGAPPYTTDWSGPDGFSSTDANIAGLNAGEYILTVSDSLNCLLIESFQVSQPDSILITQSSENITCAGDSDGSISVSVTGGTPPYIASWSGPDGFTALDTVLTNLAPGTYTLVLTDDNGCSANTEVTITEEPEIAVVENITDISCSGAAEGAIDISIAGGNLPLDIAWSGPGGFSSDQADIANLIAGDYTLVITDINGCVFAENYTVAETDPILIDANISPASCAGDDDASISVTVSGGTPEYAYSWSGPDGFTANTADISNLAPGEYTLVVTDALNCQLEELFSLTEPEPLVITTDNVQPECLESNGSASVQVSGGTIPYTYQWEDEDGNVLGTNPLLENLSAGLYLITVVDSNNCVVSEWITLSNPGEEITAEVTDVNCNGESDGSITTEVLNATEPLIYDWSNASGFSADTPDIFNLEANIYNLVVTDSLGCVYVESFEVMEPDSISLIAVVTGISCFGGDGAIDVNILGGTPPYTINWTGPDGFTSDTTNISGLSTGTYTATVIDTHGCISETVIDLAPLPEIEIELIATDLSCFDSADGAINTTVTGGQPEYEYIWIGPGGYLSDSLSIGGLEAGFYELQVTDANGCVATESILVDAPDEIEIVVDVINSTCGNDNGSLSVVASGGTVLADYNYTWFDSDNAVIATTAGVENLGPGAYTIVVTDDNGCETSDTIVISDADGEILADIVMPSCVAGNDGSIDITISGGTEPYTYSWTGPNGFTSSDQNIDNLLPGSYIIEVTDSLGCIFAEVFELDIPETVILDLEVTPITCAGNNDGSITLTIDGGLAPYTIEWTGPNGFTSTDTLLINLEPGFYEVTVTDSLLCSASAGLTLAEPAPLTADFVVVDNLCPDDTNGAITVSVSGGTAPYEFQWVGPDGFQSQGQNLGGLFSGIYDLQITDTLGCTAEFQVEVSSTPPIVIDLNITSPLCFGDSTGIILANVSGGTPTFNYDWSGPNGFSAQDSAIANLITGEYQLTVTDINGCSLMIDTVLTQPDSLYAEVELTPISCYGESDGAIDVTVFGGTSPYSYQWNGSNGFSDTTASIANLESGVYQLTYTDSLGCFGEFTGEIIEPDSLSISLETVNDAICNNDNSGFIEISVSGGSLPYSYNWSGPNGYTSEDQNPDSLLPGDYVLELIDQNGCTANLEVSVDFTLEIGADAGPDNAICENEQPLILIGTGTNSTEVWWTDSIGNVLSNNDTLSVLQPPGDYTFYYYASNGLCIELDSVSVTIYSLPDASAGSNQTIVEGEEVTLGGNPTGDSGNDILWVPAETLNDSTVLNPIGTPNTTTTFEVIVTDLNGCVNNDFTVVTVIPDIDIPSGISPNGDNYNDAWIIDHIELFPGNIVEVYNRWGDLLYRAEGYDNNEPWGGFYNGVALPIGTYYYVIELNDERFPEPYTGPITIFR